MAWETFRPSKQAATPMVTITAASQLYLNRAAADALGQPRHVQLLWAGAERLVGLRPTCDDDPDGYRVTPGMAGTAAEGRAQMTAVAFLRHHGLDGMPTRRVAAEMVDGVLSFPVDEGVAPPPAPST